MSKNKGTGFRFCVRSDTNPPFFSHIWRLWRGKKSSDLYLSASRMAGILKVSLHETGDFRFAYTVERQYLKPAVSMRLDGGSVDSDRIENRWHCENNIGQNETLALRIRFPTTSLRDHTGEIYTNKEIMWIPAAPGHSVTEISILLCSPGTTSDQMIWSTDLPNGRSALVLANYDHLSFEEELHIGKIREDFLSKIQDVEVQKKLIVEERGFGMERLNPTNSTTAFSYINDDYKNLAIVEMAILENPLGR